VLCRKVSRALLFEIVDLIEKGFAGGGLLREIRKAFAERGSWVWLLLVCAVWSDLRGDG
jgi:hypothetical protein